MPGICGACAYKAYCEDMRDDCIGCGDFTPTDTEEKTMSERKAVLMECPRCGSVEFCIEDVEYQDAMEHEAWVRCRQCDWTMGELPKINVVRRDRNATVNSN